VAPTRGRDLTTTTDVLGKKKEQGYRFQGSCAKTTKWLSVPFWGGSSLGEGQELHRDGEYKDDRRRPQEGRVFSEKRSNCCRRKSGASMRKSANGKPRPRKTSDSPRRKERDPCPPCWGTPSVSKKTAHLLFCPQKKKKCFSSSPWGEGETRSLKKNNPEWSEQG